MEAGGNLLTLRTEAKLTAIEDGSLSADFKMRAGETVAFSLTFAIEAPATIPPLGETV